MFDPHTTEFTGTLLHSATASRGNPDMPVSAPTPTSSHNVACGCRGCAIASWCSCHWLRNMCKICNTCKCAICVVLIPYSMCCSVYMLLFFYYYYYGGSDMCAVFESNTNSPMGTIKYIGSCPAPACASSQRCTDAQTFNGRCSNRVKM